MHNETRSHILGATLFAIAAMTATTLMVSCGGSGSGGAGTTSAATDANSTTATRSCDVSTQPVCPSTPPSYASDITTVISTYCLECHDPNGIGAATTGPGGGAGAGPGRDPNFTNDPNAPADPNRFNANPNNWDPSDAHDWSKYNNIKANVTLIEQQVFLCNMPPNGAVPLSDADRQTLLQWLSCGAPNN